MVLISTYLRNLKPQAVGKARRDATHFHHNQQRNAVTSGSPPPCSFGPLHGSIPNEVTGTFAPSCTVASTATDVDHEPSFPAVAASARWTAPSPTRSPTTLRTCPLAVAAASAWATSSRCSRPLWRWPCWCGASTSPWRPTRPRYAPQHRSCLAMLLQRMLLAVLFVVTVHGFVRLEAVARRCGSALASELPELRFVRHAAALTTCHRVFSYHRSGAVPVRG